MDRVKDQQVLHIRVFVQDRRMESRFGSSRFFFSQERLLHARRLIPIMGSNETLLP